MPIFMSYRIEPITDEFKDAVENFKPAEIDKIAERAARRTFNLTVNIGYEVDKYA